jgi:hypothetical protein
MTLCIDLGLRGVEQLVSVAPVEDDETDRSESKDERCNA